MSKYYEEHKPEVITCQSRRLVDGELVVCGGKIVEHITIENGRRFLVEACALCGTHAKLELMPMADNVVRKRSLSDEVFRTPMQYLL